MYSLPLLLHAHVSEKLLFEGSEQILYTENKLATGFKKNFMEAERTGLKKRTDFFNEAESGNMR